MVEINNTEIVISFPNVDEEAKLRIHFAATDSPKKPLPLEKLAETGVRLVTLGRVIMFLRPEYPFALLLSVRGKNAITGEVSETLIRNPQNYFVSPPQGGIDGYFCGGRVLPFRAAAETPENRTRLDIDVLPIKKKVIEYFRYQRQLIPGPGPMISGLTLKHGGERECEPVYEDLCNIGSWDKTQQEQVVVWLSGES